MKVIKNYLYNAGYQILLMLAPVLTTPYVSRVLGAHNNGINTYTNGWVTFFYLLGQLGVMLYGNRQIAYERENKYKRSRIFWGITSLQIMTSFTALIAYLIAVFLFSSAFKEYFLLQALWIVAYGIDISWYFMGMEDFKKTVTRNTIVKLVTIALIFILVRNSNDLSKYIFLLGFAQVAGSITLWPYLRKSIQWVKIREWHPFKHFYPALLLFIPTITTQIYLVVNRIMLGRMAPQAAVSQFNFGDNIVKLVLAIVTATGTVMLPHIANKFASGDIKGVRDSLYKSFDFVTAVSVPMMFGLMAIAYKFAPWFLGNEYGPTGGVIFWEAPAILMIAWSNVTGTQYLMPIHREHQYTISVTVGAVVNIIANLFLISLYGANGAAVATVISEFSVTAVQLFYIRGTIRRRQLFASTWRYLVSGLFMYIVVSRINSIMNMTIVNLIVQILVGVVVYAVCLFITHAPIIQQAKVLLKNK
ncbi:flippase [Limosilactobacillus reuteri]|uniref:Oligosaccharide flippase family protein n=1 Tax=Limosilactobacillus reuteri TaxID=1598 RepID=A0A347TAB5_LIMRT|nr:flippase [Limosilactobacillus reuteri]AXX74864.1 flippase [Limosilactobacillus reuteri]MCC4340797.1 flippase [Limosilactobacillus reuteri]MCC4350811.1 flippase [Limosilactobacillus reuteri]MCC4359842.1 flippase [Limosilactobacillus reuteri]MCC4378593.1 flippase [Limosilactobacillus reuteri]